jgi:hypothetical protein
VMATCRRTRTGGDSKVAPCHVYVPAPPYETGRPGQPSRVGDHLLRQATAVLPEDTQPVVDDNALLCRALLGDRAIDRL